MMDKSSLTDHFGHIGHIWTNTPFPDRGDLEIEKQGTRFGKPMYNKAKK